MKAIVWTKYGSPDGLHLKEVEKPTPKDNEVLIRVRAATVTAGDCEIRSFKLPLWLKLPIRLYMGVINPREKILGQELAGEIETVGQEVSQFNKGDAVFAATSFGFGAYAEYVCLPAQSQEAVVALKPTNMTFEEAAAVPVAGLEALYFIRKANIQPGQTVLINGAGGSIGTFALQLAKYYGAEVTAVDSTAKLDILRSIGADHVLDFTQGDFTTRAETYDVIMDVPGKSSFSRSVALLKPNGRYLAANPGLFQMIRGQRTMSGGRQIIFGPADRRTADLLFLKELIEAGKIKSIIDKRYPLEQTADAHRYVDSGQKKGNIVITV